jgi:hypothetical protein
LLTGLTFVSYFSSVEDLYGAWQWLSIAGLSVPIPDWNIYQVVFISIFTVATYMNAGWMREQYVFSYLPVWSLPKCDV